MKGILKFDLLEDREDFAIACKYRDFYMALSDIKEKFRQHEKYDGQPVTGEEVWDIIIDRGLGEFF